MKKYTQTMKIEDLELEDSEAEQKEDKRKRLGQYKTFKKKQEQEMGSFQINIIENETKNMNNNESHTMKELAHKYSIKGEQLSGENYGSEFTGDSIFPGRKRKKKTSSAILDQVKIGTDSFRTLKDHKFSDDYTIIN